MSKREFKVGDRVAGDTTSDCQRYKRIRGAFTGWHEGSPMIRQDGEHFSVSAVCAPNSIKRLVKKPRRRVWVANADLAPHVLSGSERAYVHGTKPGSPFSESYTEFVEVRRSK